MEKLPCNSCRQHTNHKVIRSYCQPYWPEDDPRMQIDYAKGTWEIIQCAGCDKVSFREIWHTSEDEVSNEGPVPTVFRYPEADKDQLTVKSFRQAPYNIYRIYEEPIQSFNIGNYILCAAGLRAVIEGICEEEIAKNGQMSSKKLGTLQKKINGLHETKILSERHAEILHALRFIGNEAVHQLTAPPEDDLKAAIEIVEHTLENLYGLSAKGYGLLVKTQKPLKKS